MTPDRTIEQLLDRWMLEGPQAAPDRVLNVVADRIEREPQRPSWLARRPNAPSNARLAAAGIAAVLVVAVGLGLVVQFSNSAPSGPAVAPSGPAVAPAPTRSPTPTFQCSGGSTGCAGPLSAGTHTSTQAGIGYQVPAGWVNLFDRDGAYLLSPEGAALAAFPDGIGLFRNPVIANECTSDREPGLGHSMADFVAHLTANPDLVATPPKPVSIGGLTGRVFDLTAGPGWMHACPRTGTGQYLTDYGVGIGFTWGIGAGERQRVYVLDRGAGSTIVISVDSVSGTTFDALIQQATPIVNSFTFRDSDHSTPESPSPSPQASG